MLKRLLIIVLTLLPFSRLFAASESDSLRTVEMEQIVVKAARSLRDIGVQKSIMNEAVLKDNLAASMAEVLAQNSSIFIKSSGRATLATASLRGTAPSHTSVSWNGIELSSPMLGMADLSLVPSYFVDGSEVYHGATSVNVSGGGLGGAVVFSTARPMMQGLDLQCIQSVASFSTHDEFLRVNYGGGRWSSSTRLLHSASKNDFPYINYDKLGHPLEYNRSCGYRDFHLLQEFYLLGKGGSLWSIKGWYTDSSRGIPKLSVDFRDDDLTKAWQDDGSLRTVAEWRRSFGGLRLRVNVGYNYDNLHYIYQFSKGAGLVQRGVDSRSTTHHALAKASMEWSVGNNLMLAANFSADSYSVDSKDVAPLVPTGFYARRNELASFISARWKPAEWVGVAANVRSEERDGTPSPLIPAAFVDITLLPQWGLILSGSVARNYHHPTLNDLYYVPGGNPDLLPEEGITSDVGLETTIERSGLKINGKVTLYRADIQNWILWTPTIKGFWTPENLAHVVSGGVESRLGVGVDLASDTHLGLNAVFAYTASENATPDDAHYGNQLPYIPKVSASTGARLDWRNWSFDCKWRYYGDRPTSYSGFDGDVVSAYSLCDVSIGSDWQINKVRFKVRFEVANLFDTVYQSVLSRPMPPRNYSLSLECRFSTR